MLLVHTGQNHQNSYPAHERDNGYYLPGFANFRDEPVDSENSTPDASDQDT